MERTKNILFLLQYPLKSAPSQRFRVELFFPELEKANLKYTWQSFIDEKTWDIFYKSGHTLKKITGVLKGFYKRSRLVLTGLKKFDYVFIQREASPLGPPVFEWVISKVLKKKMIYDFDDAIWIPEKSGRTIFNFFKSYYKVGWICKWAYKVVPGNDFLCNYARKFNSDVIRIPTCVDTIHEHNRLANQQNKKIAIGWTGSHSTMKYLNDFYPVFEELKSKYDIEWIIISNKAPDYISKGIRYVKWRNETEIEDLMGINIGVMPLKDDAWSEGKCGFKLIQYMALGIPAVASPVGVNKSIIEQGKNGFLCKNKVEWIECLSRLIEDNPLRNHLGEQGRLMIEHEYSVLVHAPIFINLFE